MINFKPKNKESTSITIFTLYINSRYQCICGSTIDIKTMVYILYWNLCNFILINIKLTFYIKKLYYKNIFKTLWYLCNFILINIKLTFYIKNYIIKTFNFLYKKLYYKNIFKKLTFYIKNYIIKTFNFWYKKLYYKNIFKTLWYMETYIILSQST